MERSDGSNPTTTEKGDGGDEGAAGDADAEPATADSPPVAPSSSGVSVVSSTPIASAAAAEPAGAAAAAAEAAAEAEDNEDEDEDEDEDDDDAPCEPLPPSFAQVPPMVLSRRRKRPSAPRTMRVDRPVSSATLVTPPSASIK